MSALGLHPQRTGALPQPLPAGPKPRRTFRLSPAIRCLPLLVAAAVLLLAACAYGGQAVPSGDGRLGRFDRQDGGSQSPRQGETGSGSELTPAPAVPHPSATPTAEFLVAQSSPPPASMATAGPAASGAVPLSTSTQRPSSPAALLAGTAESAPTLRPAPPPSPIGTAQPSPTARPALAALPIAPADPAPSGRLGPTALPIAPAGQVPTARPQAAPSPTARIEPSGRAAPPVDRAGPPAFSNVAKRTPSDVVPYLAGRLAGYAGGKDAVLDFSPSNILETMDTAVLDQVGRDRGAAGLAAVYDSIAVAILATLVDQYPGQWVLVPLDAGHGGKQGAHWDPGAAGTEAAHNRGVVAALMRQGQEPAFARVILRPIYDDAVDDSFGLPKVLDKAVVNHLLVRQARAAMLAEEAARWNAAHAETPVAVHEIAVHFNAGAGGAMVLHQGDTVRPEFRARSIDFARRYLRRVVADLNAASTLPAPLRLWGTDGLHDDVMMYRPDYLSDADIAGLTLRYAGLQGVGYLSRYVSIVLSQSSLR